MNSRHVLFVVAVVGAVALFAAGSRFYSDSNIVDPHGPTRTQVLMNLDFQMDALRQAGVPGECVDKITAAGQSCIETCLPHQYMLGTELHPPSATTAIVCEVAFCACSDGRKEDF